jgi:hypothetical protein
MDQACAFGRTPVLMTYDGDVLGVQGAAVGAALHLVLVDLAASKDTVIILEQLQVCARNQAHFICWSLCFCASLLWCQRSGVRSGT